MPRLAGTVATSITAPVLMPRVVRSISKAAHLISAVRDWTRASRSAARVETRIRMDRRTVASAAQLKAAGSGLVVGQQQSITQLSKAPSLRAVTQARVATEPNPQ